MSFVSRRSVWMTVLALLACGALAIQTWQRQPGSVLGVLSTTYFLICATMIVFSNRLKRWRHARYLWFVPSAGFVLVAVAGWVGDHSYFDVFFFGIGAVIFALMSVQLRLEAGSIKGDVR